jgi:hypothetical protein
MNAQQMACAFPSGFGMALKCLSIVFSMIRHAATLVALQRNGPTQTQSTTSLATSMALPITRGIFLATLESLSMTLEVQMHARPFANSILIVVCGSTTLPTGNVE